MMKFQKKLVLDNTTLSDTVFFRSSHAACIDACLACCLQHLEKLTCRLSHYLVLRKRTQFIKHRLYHFSKKIINVRLTSDKTSQTINWPSLIKATTAHHTAFENPANDRSNELSGRSVLCGGGRMTLYPKYSQLIENSGGNFLTFRGDANDHLGNLLQLLNKTDMVICPVDCVNHEAFFVVKHYCQYSGKPCVLLDRSALNTFHRGINILANMIARESTIHSSAEKDG